MKFTIDKHSFEKDDICTCIATYYDKKKKLVYTTDKLLKNAVLCKIQLIKKIGSKAINYDN